MDQSYRTHCKVEPACQFGLCKPGKPFPKRHFLLHRPELPVFLLVWRELESVAVGTVRMYSDDQIMRPASPVAVSTRRSAVNAEQFPFAQSPISEHSVLLAPFSISSDGSLWRSVHQGCCKRQECLGGVQALLCENGASICRPKALRMSHPRGNSDPRPGVLRYRGSCCSASHRDFSNPKDHPQNAQP